MTSFAMVALRWWWAGAAGLMLLTGQHTGTANTSASSVSILTPAAVMPTEEEFELEVCTDSVFAEPDVTRICRVTAYCDRGVTAAGTMSGVGQCAAPEDIPFGTEVYIPELDRTFIVTDRTHKRFRQNTVDLFMPGYEQCKLFGRNYLECQFRFPDEEWKRPRDASDRSWTQRYTRNRNTFAKASS
jgi:3D (Asp-Asp-Asp) domain-containing protein